MSQEQVSGAHGTQGGDPSDQNNQSTSSNENEEAKKPQESQTKTVSWSDHQRVLSDMHRDKAKRVAAEQALENVQSEKLREDNNFKELYELEKTKRESLEGKLGQTNEAFVKTQKYNAVKTEAIKQGLIHTEDLSLVDLEAVQVEVVDGEQGTRFEVRGVDTFVDTLKTSRPHWFKSNTAPSIDSRTGAKPSNKSILTAHDVVVAERNFKRGTLTQTEYHNIHNRFVSQKASG